MLVLALSAPAAVAAPQFGQSSQTQLSYLNDVTFAFDSAPRYWSATMRTGTCSRSWWDIPSLSLALTPVTWAVQEFNRAETALWTAVAGVTACVVELESPIADYVPEAYWFTSFEPLTLSNSQAFASSDPGTSDPISSTVPPKLTPISGSEAARALRRAWTKTMQRAPSKDVVLVLTAHWAHETHGGRSMFNFNFGGIKGKGPDGLSCVREAHEGSGYHVRALLDRFRVYRDAKEGAEDYLSLLMRKYPAAVEAAERGDVTDFVGALKRGGYFTGSEADYARSLSELVIRAYEQGFDTLSRLPTAG